MIDLTGDPRFWWASADFDSDSEDSDYDPSSDSDSDAMSDEAIGVPYDTVALIGDQANHVKRLNDIMERSKYALDLSKLGMGKTYAATALALDRRFDRVIVVAPKSVISKWKDMSTRFGLPLISEDIDEVGPMTFSGMRGDWGRRPPTKLLNAHEWIEKKFRNGALIEQKKTEFTPSDLYTDLIRRGVLLIFDEFQHIKNDSRQTKAAKAMICAIASSAGSSRVLLLSGSPIDKGEQVTRLLRSVGVLTRELMAGRHPTGYADVVEYCRRIDAVETDLTSNGLIPYSIESATRLTVKLFLEVINPHVSSSIEAKKSDYAVRTCDAFFAMPYEFVRAWMFRHSMQLIKLWRKLARTKNAKGMRMDKGGIPQSERDQQLMGELTNIQLAIETAKLDVLWFLTKGALCEKANVKVVVCLNYRSSMEYMRQMVLKELPSEYPMVMDGNTSSTERDRIRTRFQRPDTQFRILITNIKVAGTGIDLDDKHGDFPRKCFISPCLDTMGLYQMTHRFERIDTKSSAEVYMVWVRDYEECEIRGCTDAKGAMMRSVVQEQVKAGTMFPGNYERRVDQAPRSRQEYEDIASWNRMMQEYLQNDFYT